MPLLAFLFLLVCYWLSGHGILTIFRLQLKNVYAITLSLLLGIAVASFVPFLLQLFYIALTGPAVFGALLLTALLLNIPVLFRIYSDGFPAFIRERRNSFSVCLRRFKEGRFRAQFYEIPYWLIIGFLIFVSVWRCYYLPPTSRDVLSGPEAIAEYAAREGSMINSFFQIDLWSTNNQFKSPFLISLQLIYKLAGFPFGQIWLSILFISFIVFLYHALKEKLHPVLAGLLLLLFLMSPEIYAYTFMILYDYSNMVFYSLGLYFLFDYFRNRNPATFQFAGLLLGIATYIRSETLVLVVLLLPLILLLQRNSRRRTPAAIRSDLFFLVPSLLGYLLPIKLYIKYYLPIHYDIGAQLNDHLADWHPLFQRYGDIFSKLLFGTFAIHLWGYIYYLTAILFLAELIFIRRFNKEARNWLYAMVTLYIALGVLGYALPMFNLLETTKRALFKMMPLALFYLANNEILLRFSQRISRWEAPHAHTRPKP